MEASPEVYEQAGREIKRLEEMASEWSVCPNCKSDEGARTEFVADRDAFFEVYCKACGATPPNGRAMTDPPVIIRLPPDRDEAEKAWIAAIAEICSPRNAERNPELAAVMAVLRPEVAEGFEALCRRKQTQVAAVGIAITRALTGEAFNHERTIQGLAEFLTALGDVTTEADPSPFWKAVEATAGGGDSEVLTQAFNLDSPLCVAINQALVEGVPLTAVPVSA